MSEREAFEKWAKPRGWNLYRPSKLSDYEDDATNDAFTGWKAALAYARSISGESLEQVGSIPTSPAHSMGEVPEVTGSIKDDNLASPTNLMEATGLSATSGNTEGFATREDAKPVASASDDSRLAFAKFWKEDSGWYEEGAEGLAEHVLAEKAFNAGWQACEAQHQQKVRDCIDDIKSLRFNGDSQEESIANTAISGCIKLINKHFGE